MFSMIWTYTSCSMYEQDSVVARHERTNYMSAIAHVLYKKRDMCTLLTFNLWVPCAISWVTPIAHACNCQVFNWAVPQIPVGHGTCTLLHEPCPTICFVKSWETVLTIHCALPIINSFRMDTHIHTWTHCMVSSTKDSSRKQVHACLLWL